MVQVLGYHDAYASGVIHGSGWRIGPGDLDSSRPATRSVPSGWLTARFSSPQRMARCDRNVSDLHGILGLLRRVQHVPIVDIDPADGKEPFFSATTIYLTPTTLSGITVNFLMSLAGGLIMSDTGSPSGDRLLDLSGWIGRCASSRPRRATIFIIPIQAFLLAILGSLLCLSSFTIGSSGSSKLMMRLVQSPFMAIADRSA